MRLFIGMAALLMLASCSKDSVSGTVNLPVVEAYLVAGNPLTVKLYQQKVLTDTAKYGAAIKGLKVYVSDGANNVLLTESAAGTYTYSDKTFLVAGKTYSLQFTYQSQSVTATTVMPQKPVGFATQNTNIYIAQSSINTTLDTLNRFTWQNPDSLNHVLVFLNGDGASFPLNSFGISRAYNFELNTDQLSVYYITQRTFAYYGHYQAILYSVNTEFINLFKSNTFNSSSQSLSNTPTNVVNGFGIFTAMQGDTVAFNVLN
jgi:hypothetical protein